MSKICTSIEQSKILIEFGINVNTADMFYADILIDGNHKYNLHPLESYGFKTFGETKLKTSDHLSFIPAWSLTALMGLIPKFSLEKDISNNEGYQLHYNYNTTYYDEPVDAAFEMVCWLKKYNKL